MRRSAGSGSSEPTAPAIDADPAQPAVLLVAGAGFVSTYDLGERELIIGRGDRCDIVIEHAAMSRRHAVVLPGPPVTVQDLDSINGTRIAGVLHRGGAPIELSVGAGFNIGPFSFVVLGRSLGTTGSLSGRDVLRVLDPTPRGVSSLVRDFAASEASVLILGETGVGKEVLSATLHELSGRTGVLTRINCAALSESLAESELFGHEKGAFTGAVAPKVGLLESASGGTIFLDEVGEMPLAIQAKLLRAVEQREVLRVGSTRPIPIDVRIIAATNRDLPSEVAAGRFRSDLYFRLDGITLVIPPLRERRTQIGAMALAFLQATRHRSGQPARLTADALLALEAHAWPGNVRELKSVIERAVVLSRTGEIEVRHLAFARRSVEPPPAPAEEPRAVPPALDFLDDAQRAERARIVAALEACGGNQTRAAKQLGIGRTALVHRVGLYRIPRPKP